MDQLFFFSKSADKKAGKGTNEQVSDYTIYKELNEIKNWRKILSNFYVSEFKYRGKTYKTVEHAFQGEKIALVDVKKANWFSVDSGHKIGITENGLIARKNRKLIILNNNQLHQWNLLKHDIMKKILLAKFSQINLAKRVLLLTKNAILLHVTRFIRKQRQYDLEYVRNKLKNI